MSFCVVEMSFCVIEMSLCGVKVVWELEGEGEPNTQGERDNEKSLTSEGKCGFVL